MDYKKSNAPTNTVTRDMQDFRDKTGNVYESIAIMGKRANQISVEIKDIVADVKIELPTWFIEIITPEFERTRQ